MSLPKKGQTFNARTKEFGNIAVGCPCKCTRTPLKPYAYVVLAIDVNGRNRAIKDHERLFDVKAFDFEILKKAGQ